MGDTWTGKRVRCTSWTGDTFETVARSEPFLNKGYVGRGMTPWMVVAVDWLEYPKPVNWPLADVELLPSDEGGSE